ncbi:MAG: ABC transporter permease [Clostridia bacterium]|nr:ABC transporter permease [Clostridia bacterium]
MLLTFIGIVIVVIIITSIFCIRNSFAIATTEKIKMYSMLASVGTTKKQIKKNVIFEGLTLGFIGIPFGILSGFFAVYVLLKIVNLIIGDYLLAHVDGLVFKISLIPILLSIILGFLTIYLSARSSAKKASKVSPIEGLRNSNEIKVESKKLKTPKIIQRLFKTGGILAYKNLKRSKKKYRTTVISIAISIFIFITMNAFITNMFDITGDYYIDYSYNLQLNTRNLPNEDINKILNKDGIKQYSILYDTNKSSYHIKDMSKINLDDVEEAELADEGYYDENKKEFIITGGKYIILEIVALDNEAFKRFSKDIGVKYEDIKNKGILCDEYGYTSNGKEVVSRTYKYNKGDKILRRI